jgi:hypothetical protein
MMKTIADNKTIQVPSMACDDKNNRFYTRRFKKNVKICAYYKMHIFIVCVITV